MENAIKYGDGKKIDVAMEFIENCVVITVSNSGCNLLSHEVNHIFDSFYRGSNTKNINGSGLGLYICKVLMHKMEGEVYACVNDNDILLSVAFKLA